MPGRLSREQFEHKLFGELSKLIPDAIAQAKQGKPALLRILTRAAGRARQQPEEEPEPDIIVDIPNAAAQRRAPSPPK